jgi:hypothetical protein
VKSGRSDPEIQTRSVISNTGFVRWAMPPDATQRTFRNVIVTELLASEGDSGTVLVAKDDNSAVGLVCAITDNETLVVSMEAIRDTLGVTIKDKVWPAV